ncbi:molecular chaperone [Providencia sneebia]|uniref:Putative fimbrial chaperone n=1 Tax=Providencia sneebia DSM 19967 TaxID=1141660 RepID=K8WHZ2_9GAMM|nr:molecular chaperone [Providencia sneebia]EKT60164.1 putative fimbrial chaperone [Providencia sneebia DSM 19967]
MFFYRSLQAFLCVGYFTCASAIAGIYLDNSRIIFSSADTTQGQTIGISNSASSASPYLVKAQVLGDIQGTQTQTPFSVTPSLFRLEKGMKNQLRILKTGQTPLPKDRESVFYLRVIALPAGVDSDNPPKSEVGGAVIVSTGSVIKLFYRPQGLPISQQQAMSALQFSRQGSVLNVKNSSPYFITLSSLTVGEYKVPMSVQTQNTLIPPFGEMHYPNVNIGGNVTWRAINDYGGTEEFHGVVQ